jgi:hypothetical protein
MNCDRCGIEIDPAIISKRKTRGSTNKNCADCNLGPSLYIKQTQCRPHRGLVDDDLNPIDEYLRPYKPGIRTCGNKDCIARDHIVPAEREIRDEALLPG